MMICSNINKQPHLPTFFLHLVVHSCKLFFKYCCHHPCCLIGVSSNKEMFQVSNMFFIEFMRSYRNTNHWRFELFSSSTMGRKYTLSLTSFLPLYSSPFWTKLFSGICQTNHFISNEFAFWGVLAQHTL
jgi:hypothetical protein